MCKPCSEPFVDFQEGAGRLRVAVPESAKLTQGKRYKLSVSACRDKRPSEYQLRGYEPAS
jgi:hypothetical protein